MLFPSSVLMLHQMSVYTLIKVRSCHTYMPPFFIICRDSSQHSVSFIYERTFIFFFKNSKFHLYIRAQRCKKFCFGTLYSDSVHVYFICLKISAVIIFFPVRCHHERTDLLPANRWKPFLIVSSISVFLQVKLLQLVWGRKILIHRKEEKEEESARNKTILCILRLSDTFIVIYVYIFM